MKGMKKALNSYLKSGFVQERKIEKKKIPYILDQVDRFEEWVGEGCIDLTSS